MCTGNRQRMNRGFLRPKMFVSGTMIIATRIASEMLKTRTKFSQIRKPLEDALWGELWVDKLQLGCVAVRAVLR